MARESDRGFRFPLHAPIIGDLVAHFSTGIGPKESALLGTQRGVQRVSMVTGDSSRSPHTLKAFGEHFEERLWGNSLGTDLWPAW